jgi:hypothetical protein
MMKKALFIFLFTIVACKRVTSNQEKAEIAVKNYLHVNLDSDSAKKMKFTPLDASNRQIYTIGLIDGAKIPVSGQDPLRKKSKPFHFTMVKILWFQINPDSHKIIDIYTN